MPEEFNSNLNAYLEGVLNCPCGKKHTTMLKHVELSMGANKKLPSMLKQSGYHSIFMLADYSTMKAAGNDILQLLNASGFSVTASIFQAPDLVPDEKALGKLLVDIKPETDLVIAVGTGTLNDLGKFISYKLRIPFYIVATAPSMDGFASNVSCLITNHMKTTYETHVPEAIIADIAVLTQAPDKMIAAGVGDILGKYICLLDWKLSSIITGEYHCSFVEQMVKRSIDTVVNELPNLAKQKEKAVHGIMEGLILSGIAMSYIGNSRPASGSEHHLSHFWELNFLASGTPAVLHGIKVGIGTVMASRLYELLLSTTKPMGSPDFKRAEKHISEFSSSHWELDIKHNYGSGAEEVLALEQKIHKNGTTEVLERISLLKEHWTEISFLMKEYLPGTEYLANLLRMAGAPVEPAEEGISSTLVHTSILYAKELRNRYGLLQLLFDLGLSEEFAIQIDEYTKSLNLDPLILSPIDIMRRR